MATTVAKKASAASKAKAPAKPRAKAKAKAKSTVKKVVPIDENSSEGIDAQVQAFLSSGNKIQEIPVGTSGITHTGGTKHITISRNKPQDQRPTS